MQDMSFYYAEAVPRGCGEARKRGAIYAELGLAPKGKGKPVEDFLIDPPALITFDVPTQGIMPLERDGVTYLVDYVGSEFYPNVADFIEEVRRFGLSRRLPETLDFNQITGETRLLMVHKKAWINGPFAFPMMEDLTCPCDHPNDHWAQDGMCARLWWRDVVGGEPIRNYGDYPGADLTVEREMPSFAYVARRAPDNAIHTYQMAIFASFPLSRLVVVRGEHERALDKARQAHINVEEVDE